jgi:glycine cleavage system transcriptional repressor
MKKHIVTVIGSDSPGILAAVSGIISESGGNIEDISQTILQDEFAGIFIITMPDTCPLPDLEKKLRDVLEPKNLQFYIKSIDRHSESSSKPEVQPFIITTTGPDRTGLVAGITSIIASHGVNITNFRAVFRGGDNPMDNIMFYEVDVPDTISHVEFAEKLRKHALDMNLEINIQHRYIFEAINKI